jgi:hypothetical protein
MLSQNSRPSRRGDTARGFFGTVVMQVAFFITAFAGWIAILYIF